MNYETPKTDVDSEQEIEELKLDEQRYVSGGIGSGGLSGGTCSLSDFSFV